MKLSSLKLDVDASENGAWFNYHGDIEFKIARLGNKKYALKYASELNLAFEEFGQQVPTHEYERMMSVALATCITDWKGIADDDDTPIEYSEAFAEEILLNPEYGDIKDFVALKANLRANFKKKQTINIKK